MQMQNPLCYHLPTFPFYIHRIKILRKRVERTSKSRLLQIPANVFRTLPACGFLLNFPCFVAIKLIQEQFSLSFAYVYALITFVFILLDLYTYVYLALCVCKTCYKAFDFHALHRRWCDGYSELCISCSCSPVVWCNKCC